MPAIFYTADVVTPDGSDTSVYGDPTQEESGATLTTGWYSPDRGQFDVYEEREQVSPDVYPGIEDEGDPAPSVWLARKVWERLEGFPEHNRDGWWSGASYEHPYTGQSVSVAAHAEGFTDQEHAEAIEMVAKARIGYPRRRMVLDSSATYAEFMAWIAAEAA